MVYRIANLLMCSTYLMVNDLTSNIFMSDAFTRVCISSYSYNVLYRFAIYRAERTSESLK